MILKKPKAPMLEEHYEFIHKIGIGSTAVVYKVKNRHTGDFYACKAINVDYLQDEDNQKRIEQEIQIHLTLDHPFVTKLIEVIHENNSIFMITEYCPKGNLLELLNKKKKRAIELSKNIFHQLMDALAYIHRSGYAHCDIKPENIMFDSNMNIKLTDLGSAVYATDKPPTTINGTLLYISPELANCNCVDRRKSDIWAAGIVLHGIFAGASPFHRQTRRGIVLELRSGNIKSLPSVPAGPAAVINQCFTTLESERPTAEELSLASW